MTFHEPQIIHLSISLSFGTIFIHHVVLTAPSSLVAPRYLTLTSPHIAYPHSLFPYEYVFIAFNRCIENANNLKFNRYCMINRDFKIST